MAEQEKRLELEPEVRMGDRVLIPVAWTVGRPVVRRHGLTACMCREALGVIVRDDEGFRVLLCDGRVLSLSELVEECPSLHDAVAGLR